MICKGECTWGHYEGPCKNMDKEDKRRMGVKRCMICRTSKYYNMDEEQLPPYEWRKPE